jgi:hypothetical protein
MYWLVLLRVWSSVPSAKLRCRCCLCAVDVFGRHSRCAARPSLVFASHSFHAAACE